MRITLNCSLGWVNDTQTEEIEVDNEEWEGMTPKQRNDFLLDSLQCHVENFVESWWEIEDE